MKRTLVILALIAAGTVLGLSVWATRYQYINHDLYHGSHLTRINRWTGKTCEDSSIPNPRYKPYVWSEGDGNLFDEQARTSAKVAWDARYNLNEAERIPGFNCDGR